jgi:NitT/TauT family transport system permease protein
MPPMASIAVEPPGQTRVHGAVRGATHALLVLAGVAAFWGLWEAYRWIGMRLEITWPFPVNETNMPHIHEMLRTLGKPLQPGGPLLIQHEWHWALFTGKEALLGFLLGGAIGFVLAVILAHSRILRRGLLPYIVVSQTVPILAVAPMVVVGLGTKGVKPWLAVSVIAAYLTFFPVAVNTLRGLLSPDPRALELMRSYAAGRSAVLWRLRLPSSLPFVFSALKISATASVIGAIIGETPASIQDGLGGAIVNFNQYYSTNPERLWATNLVCAALGIFFFCVVILAERLILRRAPEHIA